MTAETIYRAKCGRDFTLQEVQQGQHILVLACSVSGIPAGSTLGQLVERCASCQEVTRYAEKEQGVKSPVFTGIQQEKTSLPTIVEPLWAPPTQASAMSEAGQGMSPPAQTFVPPAPVQAALTQQEVLPQAQTTMPPEPKTVNLATMLAQQPQEAVAQPVSAPTPIATPTLIGQTVAEAEAPVQKQTQQLDIVSLLNSGTLSLPGLPGTTVMSQEQPTAGSAGTIEVSPPPEPTTAIAPQPVLQQASADSGGSDVIALVMDQLTPEDKIDVDETLGEHIKELSGGPSIGGFSWHTLDLPMSCWRKAYYSLVRGLVPKKSKRALQWGSLYHACWELWFKTGGRMSWDLPCEVIQRAGGAKLAAEVRTCIRKEMELYSHTEAQEWDIRAVENNAVFWMDSVKIDGKSVRIPISCRHDLIYAKRAPGAACAPVGPVEAGVFILDRKTASAATRDLIYGYAMDPQFMTNALVYEKSEERERFGPLLGVQAAVAVKHKTPTEKSFYRIESSVDLKTVEEFYQTEIVPCAVELYKKLFSPDREDMSKWPKKHNQCVSKYLCNFFDLCMDGGSGTAEDIYYKVDPKRIFTIERLATPPKGKSKSKKEGAKEGAETEEEKPIKKIKERKRDELHSSISNMVCQGVKSLEQFDRRLFLVPGHTERSVKTALVEKLAKFWQANFEWELQGQDGILFKCVIKGNGVAWHTSVDVGERTAKGNPKSSSFRKTVTWKSIADNVCADWWDISNHPPVGQKY